jgi:hypothetical protein
VRTWNLTKINAFLLCRICLFVCYASQRGAPRCLQPVFIKIPLRWGENEENKYRFRKYTMQQQISAWSIFSQHVNRGLTRRSATVERHRPEFRLRTLSLTYCASLHTDTYTPLTLPRKRGRKKVRI